MSAVAGLLTTGGNDQGSVTDYTQADLVGEYQEKILVRNSKGMNAGSTLFGLMSRLKAEPAENNVFNWFERNPVTRVFFTQASVTSSATTMYVGLSTGDTTNAAQPFFQANQVLMNTRTLETMLVTAVTAGSGTGVNLTITRGLNNGGTGTAMNSGDTIALLTLAQDEGAVPVNSVYEQPLVYSNYIQTFNSSVFLSNAYKANKLRSDLSGPLQQQRIQAIERIAKDIELAFLMGTKSSTNGTNGVIYTTGGVKNAIDSVVPGNALNVASGNSMATNILPWMENFMTVGSDAKLALCGPTAYFAFSQFANSASNGFRIMNQETVYGMNITVINTPFGELDLAFHPALKEVAAYVGWMFVVDLAHVIQKTMEPLFLEPNIQLPGTDAYKEQFRAKLGLKLRFPQAFGYAYNITGAFAS